MRSRPMQVPGQDVMMQKAVLKRCHKVTMVRMNTHSLIGCAPPAQKFSEESLEFQRRISQRNGLSEETYLPPALHTLPPVVTMESAREEARMVLFGAVQDVLDRTGVPAIL